MGASHSGEAASTGDPHTAKLRSYKRSMAKSRKLDAKKALTRPTQVFLYLKLSTTHPLEMEKSPN